LSSAGIPECLDRSRIGAHHHGILKGPGVGFSRSCRKSLLAGAAILGLVAADSRSSALAQAPSIVLEPVLTGLATPVFVTHAADTSGRLFVVEQGGSIVVLQAGATAPIVFLDIGDRVVAGGEQGLLGLAFHPDFASNGRFFVDYTRRADGATVIAEYRVSAADPNIADRTETVLLTIPQPYVNHNGGMLAFGPDGNLYIGMGDGGSADDPGNRAQNVDELLGKILRIDVDHPASATQFYSSPADNPFAGAVAGRDEIYALGMRNPWRFSFDRQTGDLMAGDVGQSAREEVDRIVRGGNYGWRTFEGTLCTGNNPPPCDPTPFVPPITEYDHSNGRCSITGGYVYRGAKGALPLGSYLFGDFCSGEIFLLQGSFAPGSTFAVIAATGQNISSFGEDQDGELYVVEYGGAVLRVTAPPPCSALTIAPPSLSFAAAGGSGTVNVSAPDTCDWTATTSDTWIGIGAGASGRGNGTVRYDVAASTEVRTRTGSVRIASQVHTVRQSGPARCAVEPEPRRIMIDVGGGSGTIAVTAADGCGWTVSSPVPWVVVAPPSTGSGSGLVAYTIQPSPNGTPRRTKIRIGSRGVSVAQR
jgi:glucose/arabinose dehydrogenase